MFSNRFNTKNDPLLEAAQAAMKDGDMRRQAEAVVNEQFGVYSRKAVVREDLAAYDAALEEAYGALKEGVQIDELSKDTLKSYVKKASKDMRKKSFEAGKESEADDYWGREGKERYDRKPLRKSGKRLRGIQKATDRLEEELAKKDYDKDGKIESPKDEVWGSRLRAAKAAGKMEEEQIDEVKMSKIRKLADKGDTKRLLKIGGKEMKKAQKAENKGKISKMLKHYRKGNLAMDQAEEYHIGETQIDEVSKGLLGRYVKKATTDVAMNSGLSGRHSAKRIAAKDKMSKEIHGKLSNEYDDKSVKRQIGIHKAVNKLAKEETQVDEAAYSAKAGRAGKDLGKPGKNFAKIAKIAKSAGKKYGSEERGKKVAGAILARIRAKHMKEENLEELSAFGKAFAAHRKAGDTQFSFGGKSFTTAMKGQASAPKPATSTTSTPDVKGNVSAMKAGQALAKTDAKNMRAGNSGQTNDTVTNTDSKGNTSSAAKPEGGLSGMVRSVQQTIHNYTGLGSDQRGAAEAGIGSTSAASSGITGKSVGTGTATPAIKAATAPAPSVKPVKGGMVTGGTFEESRLNESVQIGENKYRII